MKVLNYFLICFAVSLLAGCSDKNDEPGGEPDRDRPGAITDLSAVEMANCYIVREAGEYMFKADNQFNLGPSLPVPPQMSPASAELVWQSVESSISHVELAENERGEAYVKFRVDKAEGNALIAALNEKGEIEWSWHIWMPAIDIVSYASTTGYEVMNINLGAMNNQAGDPASYGMLYQWGRKDPFPPSATLTGDASTVGAPLYDIDNNPVAVTHSSWFDTSDNTIEHSIAHPTEVLSNYAQYAVSRDWLRADLSDDALWGNPEGDVRDSSTNNFVNSGVKTCYDPSPAGWRVAPADAFRDFTSTGGYSWDVADFNVADITGDGLKNMEDFVYGWHFIVNPAHRVYFPAAGRYDGSYAMLMGSVSGYWGNYWSNAPYSKMSGGAFCNLSFQSRGMNGEDMISVSASGGSSRADAFSVRCVRDL